MDEGIKWAGEALRRIGVIEAQLDGIKSDAKALIDEIKAEAAKDAEPYQAELDELVQELTEWAETNKERLTETGKKYEIQGAGEVGWRFSTWLQTADDKTSWDGVAKALYEVGLVEALNIKITANKAALKNFDDDRLERFGVARCRGDKFYYKAARPVAE